MNIEPHQNFTFSFKKSVEALDNFKIPTTANDNQTVEM